MASTSLVLLRGILIIGRWNMEKVDSREDKVGILPAYPATLSQSRTPSGECGHNLR